MAYGEIELNPGAGGGNVAVDTILGAAYQRFKQAFGVEGSATDVSPGNPLPVTDFKTEVQRGNVTGWSIFEAFGERENIGTTVTGEDIWPGTATTIPTPADAGEQMELVSTSANDTAAGPGARTVTVNYIDAAGAAQSEDVTMNALVGVPLTATTVRFVQDIHTKASGSGGVAAGAITIYKQGAASTVYSIIEAGTNHSMVCAKMVPAGKQVLMQEFHGQAAKSKRESLRISSTDADGVLEPGIFLFFQTLYLQDSATSIPVHHVHPPLSIIKVTSFAGATAGDAGCGFWGYLVDI